MKMAEVCFAIILFILVINIPNGQGKGSKKPLGPWMPVTLDPDSEIEPEDMVELDVWESQIRRDLCPWAECQYCTCNGESPICSPSTPTEYRGPVRCTPKDLNKDKSNGPITGDCFIRGGKPSMDCKKGNSDISTCFPSKTPDNVAQQICFGLFTDCEDLMEYCNCSRACEMNSRPPVVTTPVSATTTTPMRTTPKIPTTTRYRRPSTTKPITNQMNTRLGNVVTLADSTGSMVNGSDKTGRIANGSDITGTKTGTTPETATTEIQDFESGYKSMLSSVSILALSFGGLLLVVLVFIIAVICTCTCCRGCRKRKLTSKDPHAYYYVDVDRQGTLTTNQKDGKKPKLAGVSNPVLYDGHFQTVAPLTVDFEQDPDRVYAEADGSDFVVISSSDKTEVPENMYAECRPRSQRIDKGEAVTYMELNEDDDQINTPQVLTVPSHPTEMRTSAIYTDLHFGEESVSSTPTPNNSDSETSADPDETDSSSHSEESIASSTDSGVDNERQENDHALSSSSDDFEEDNATYFEAKTMRVSETARAKSTDSLNSRGDAIDQHSDLESSLGTATANDSPQKTCADDVDPLSCYQKLRDKSYGRSFSIDSACSENTYNSLVSATGSLKIVEEDGKYSTLSREGTLERSIKRDTENSDSDNTYSELIS